MLRWAYGRVSRDVEGGKGCEVWILGGHRRGGKVSREEYSGGKVGR